MKITVKTAIFLMFIPTTLLANDGYTLHCPTPQQVNSSAKITHEKYGNWIYWHVNIKGVGFYGKKQFSGAKAPIIGPLQKVELMGQAITCFYINGSLTNFGDVSAESRFTHFYGSQCESDHSVFCDATSQNCQFTFCSF